MIPTLWYIHGAHSTSRSFTYIKAQLPPHDARFIQYDHSGPVSRVVESLTDKLNHADKPVHLVGHSLGGVIAVAAAQKAKNVAKVVTMASPFGGSQVASLMRWIAPSQLLDDIHPLSTLMLAVKRATHPAPIMSIVTTAGGNTMLTGENDGVVTVASQTCLEGPVYIRIPVNHSEVLLAEEAKDLITGFIF